MGIEWGKNSLDMSPYHFDSRFLSFPYWSLAGVFALPLVYTLIRLTLRWFSHGPGLCPECGYDLRATPDRCPECGLARI